jgi:tRNA U38,U39,U40 pseudouridine synthase TruA
LIEVATTELNLSDTLSLLNDQTVKNKPPSAPPEGLILEKIEYRDISFTVNEKSLNSIRKILSDKIKHDRGQLAVTKYFIDYLSKY